MHQNANIWRKQFISFKVFTVIKIHKNEYQENSLQAAKSIKETAGQCILSATRTQVSE